MSDKKEVFISVDVETSGPIPGEYSLLTIGAVNVDDLSQTFECALKPLNRNADPRAMEVTGLTLDELDRTGILPQEAMSRLGQWLASVVGPDAKPVFVGFNAPFDWSFVNYYFHRFAGGNPFGFSALDIKAYYMGSTGCSWGDTSSRRMAAVLHPATHGTHVALDDALYQAELFRLIRRHGTELRDRT
jgi:DNA polymerase III epsilon subunit-like protein